MKHATFADLDGFLASGHGLTEGAETDRILTRASELVDDYVLTGYTTNEDGTASVPTVAGALRDATCAQVEQWLEVGEELDVTGFPDTTSIMLGRLQITDLPKTLAPRARRILRAEGLLTASTT